MQDDLAIFIALMREGTTGRAAERARCSQPTVVRRIAALEDRLGLTLFERSAQGYLPTDHARQLEPLAQRVAIARQRLEDHAHALAETDNETIRVTFLDDFRRQMLPAFRAFGATWPGVRLQLIPSYRMVDIARGEADIAVRGRIAPEDEGLVVRALPTPRWGVYVAADEARVPKGPDELDPAAIAGLAGPVGRLLPFERVRAIAHDAGHEVMEYPSYSALISAIASGVAVSVLPLAMGDPEREIRRAFIVDEDRAALPGLFLVGRRSALRRRPVRDLFDGIIASFEAQGDCFAMRPA
ncbi:LysR family transcriptional regulator [Sphingomicrobium astaxanthinifaciens]|uniref:LysR family transcriptional regulator n=1 Tax=Sphingomicrobium astaxanthinifaciens TaxID=1227949 RepID=UPI001FCC1B2F|nr:LysR family transcriptional regulator [Sphingomicrobium astaxanthinifaciens]MCJ7422309.1 LysR family transcriptional regulator [Sphingomicrobium astaxanthinifaciens]